MSSLPAYLDIPASQLGQDTSVQVVVKSDLASIGQSIADDMFEEISRNPKATLIIPVGPVDGFPILAERLRREKHSVRDITFINMDEYLAPDGHWIPLQHPLSFRGFMNRLFYDRLDPALAPKFENRVFPDPKNPGAIKTIIDSRGGVDACFGGIGINGHIAFNEPPEPDVCMTDDEFAQLPTRTLPLSRETRTINSVTVGGEITLIPTHAITVGMKEILASRRLRLYCNRPWQSAVARRALHGPITARCPASFMRTHPDARLTIADYVAAPPQIQLR